MKKFYLITACIPCFLFSPIHAQITASQITANDAVQNVLIGNGVNAFNINSFSTSPLQIGEFSNGLSAGIGIDHGVFLTSGFVNPTSGPISNPSTSFSGDSPGSPGDMDLQNICGNITLDAAILQFDFIPTGDTIKFRYVFASEEYNEFVNSQYNDVFAFLLTGPDPLGGNYVNTNIALIPSTVTPVSINNVNNGFEFACSMGPCTNCQYFVDNCVGNNLLFDAYTVVLTAIAPVIPCTTYTIKLALADAGDANYDSGVFLEAGSFTSNLVTLSSEVDYGNSDTIMYEGCSQATVQFIRGGNVSASDTVDFVVSGNAAMGSDFNSFPPYVIFPPGSDTLTLTLTPYLDGNNDPNETVTLTIYDTICGTPYVSQLTLTIVDIQDLNVTAMPDTFICAGETVNLNANITGGAGFYTTQWTWSGGNSAPPVNVTPVGNDQYVISVYDNCIDTTGYDTVNIAVYPVPNIQLTDLSVCSGSNALLGPSGSFNGFHFTWLPASNIDNPNVQNPIFTTTNPGNSSDMYVVYLEVDSNGVVCATDSAYIIVFPDPAFDLQPDSIIFCEDNSAQVTAGAGYALYTWSTGTIGPVATINQPGLYFLDVIDANGCPDRDSIIALKDFKPVFTVNDAVICSGDTAFLSVPDSLGTILWSTLETTQVIGVANQGDYVVTITNVCGPASDTASVTLTPKLDNLMMPNVFTPNGDGFNDLYEIPQLDQAESFRMDIFNRWGLRIFTSSSLLEPWTGEAATGGLVPDGTYFIVLSFENCDGSGQTVNGTILVSTGQ